MDAEKGGVKYYNHMLYCLDTIATYQNFINWSSMVFCNDMTLPVFWGCPHSALQRREDNQVDTLSKERFEILKYNTIRGASVIVNSCLFDNGTPVIEIDGENDNSNLYYLSDKYFKLYGDRKYMSDSILNKMYEDAVRLCERPNK